MNLFGYFYCALICFLIQGNLPLTSNEETHVAPCETYLEGKIIFQGTSHTPSIAITPGTPLTLGATVRNVGKQTSQQAELSIRYVLSPPFEEAKGSLLFQTEKLTLPSIKPGEEKEFLFKTPHVLPSITEFLHHNWGLRQYELILILPNSTSILANASLTPSVNYYPAILHEITQPVPCISN